VATALASRFSSNCGTTPPRLPPGTVIHLIARDPAAPVDLAAWCHLTGHIYLGRVREPRGQPAYALRTSATPRRTQPRSPWRLTR